MVVYDSVVRFWLLPTPLLSIAPFVIDGSRWESSIHGEVVYNNVFCFCEVWEVRCTCCSSVFSNTVVCCSVLCPPSQRKLSSRPPVHGVVLWVVRHRRVFIDPRVSLIEVLCHFRTLLPFACSHDLLSLWSSSPASQCHSHCGQLRLRVLFLTLLSCIARGRPHALEFCCTVFLLGEDPECLHFSFLLCTAFLLDEASTKCGYPSLLTWLCTSLSAGLPRWSFLALFHSRASSTSGTDYSASYPCCVWSFSRCPSLSLELVCCRPEICNIVSGDNATVCSRSGVSTHVTICACEHPVCVHLALCACLICVQSPSNSRYCVPAIRNFMLQMRKKQIHSQPALHQVLPR